MWHPWRRLRALTNVDLSWRPLAGLLGATDGRDRIVMDPRQSQAQRRCTVAHELAHLDLGHGGGCSPVEERAARALAARWLIDMPDLLAALAWTEHLDELADELWVDVDTLLARLDGLTASERAQVAELAQRVEGGA